MLICKFDKCIRRGMFLPLYQMSIFKETFVENQLSELDINILANDINEQQLRIIRQQSPQLSSRSYENLSIAQLDFISMHKEFIKGKLQKNDLIVITNPPWGRTVNLDKFNNMIKFLEINCNKCYLLIASDQFKNFEKRKWELLAEPLVGGQWTKLQNMIQIEKHQIQFLKKQLNNLIILNNRCDSKRTFLLERHRRISKQKLWTQQRSPFKKVKQLRLFKTFKSRNKNYCRTTCSISQEIKYWNQNQGEIHYVEKSKQFVQNKNKKFKSADNKDQGVNQEQIELKKQEVKDKVILDKYQLKQEDLEKIQKVLDEKAQIKSIKLLKQEKKRSQTIPRW